MGALDDFLLNIYEITETIFLLQEYVALWYELCIQKHTC